MSPSILFQPDRMTGWKAWARHLRHENRRASIVFMPSSIFGVSLRGEHGMAETSTRETLSILAQVHFNAFQSQLEYVVTSVYRGHEGLALPLHSVIFSRYTNTYYILYTGLKFLGLRNCLVGDCQPSMTNKEPDNASI